jgi:hypothetical protein
MNAALLKALAALVPASMLLCGSMFLFLRGRDRFSLLQVIGAGSMVVVVLTHVFEALRLFPAMQWGAEQSVGHYLDFSGAILGLTLFPAGYLLQALAKRHP